MTKQLLILSLTALLANACSKQPYNNFQPDSTPAQETAIGAGAAGIIPALASAPAGPAAIVGGVAGAAVGTYIDSEAGLRLQLHQAGIEVIEYGDTITLFVPTDRYFVFDTAELDEIRYHSLGHLVEFIQHYQNAEVTIAGFTDDVGTDEYKHRLAHDRARAMLAFIWAHGIDIHHLRAEGYGDHFDIADNNTVSGSTLNRRLEIQIRKA